MTDSTPDPTDAEYDAAFAELDGLGESIAAAVRVLASERLSEWDVWTIEAEGQAELEASDPEFDHQDPAERAALDALIDDGDLAAAHAEWASSYEPPHPDEYL